MRANYGYTDGSGEYYVTIDTDLCNGCGMCAEACPKNVFEVIPDDYDEIKAAVKEEVIKIIGVVCPGFKSCHQKEKNCQTVCNASAISHTW